MPSTADRKRLAHGFRALRVPNYRRYWLGQLASQTGSWMQITSQGWLVLTLTQSPFAIGLVTTLQFVPVMLLALIGGTISDWLPRHRLILATQWAALVQALVFGLLITSGHVRLWHVYVLAAVQGVIQALDTPARQAFTSDLVGREDVVSAIALNSMLFNAARLVGPSLAGVLIPHLGIDTLLYVNAASFLTVIYALYRMDTKALFRKEAGTWTSVRHGLSEGLLYARTTPEVRVVLVATLTMGLFGYNWSATIPLLGGLVLKTDATGLGLLWAFLGLGSLMGASGTALAGPLTLRRLLLMGAGFGVVLAGLSLSRGLVAASALLVLLGAAGILFSTAANSLLQLTVPERLRGRVMSIYYLLFVGSTPVGAFLLGSTSSLFGVPLALLLCGGLCLLGMCGALLLHRQVADSAARKALPPEE
jgi:MFS family permease